MSIRWEILRDDYIRPFLKDASSAWSDTELKGYIAWALDDFTMYFPRHRTLTLAADTSSFELPDDFYKVNLVEWQRTDYYRKFLEEVTRRPGFEFPSTYVDDSSYPEGYWVEGDTLYLGRMAEDEFTLHYFAYWPIPTGDDSKITVPRWARQALVFYVTAMALLRNSIGNAKIRQWNTKRESGKPTDEPLLPEVKFLLEQYRKILDDHISDSDWELYYEGRG